MEFFSPSVRVLKLQKRKGTKITRNWERSLLFMKHVQNRIFNIPAASCTFYTKRLCMNSRVPIQDLQRQMYSKNTEMTD